MSQKEQFYTLNGSTCFDTKKQCSIPSESTDKTQSILCGTAFDYLARFFIARIIKSNQENALFNLTADADTF